MKIKETLKKGLESVKQDYRESDRSKVARLLLPFAIPGIFFAAGFCAELSNSDYNLNQSLQRAENYRTQRAVKEGNVKRYDLDGDNKVDVIVASGEYFSDHKPRVYVHKSFWNADKSIYEQREACSLNRQLFKDRSLETETLTAEDTQ